MTSYKTHKEKLRGAMVKTFFGMLSIAVLGFVGLKVYPLIHGPSLEIATLSNGAVLSEPMIRVSGKAFHTKDLIVNGNSLALATDGSFDDKIVLNVGYNVINIQAKDRFGKLQNHNYAVVLRKEANGTLSVREVTPPTTN